LTRGKPGKGEGASNVGEKRNLSEWITEGGGKGEVAGGKLVLGVPVRFWKRKKNAVFLKGRGGKKSFAGGRGGF